MKLSNQNNLWTVALLSCILIFIAYSNTISASWQLDDMQNIVNNKRIQIKELSLKTLKESMYSHKAYLEKPYRPLSCLSFALNAFVGGTNPKGYHIVNISLHIMTTVLLAYFLNMLFGTPAIHETSPEKKYFIIILSSLLWAINPIQTQTVTYIVQRMTGLSAFFSLLSIVFYLKGRFSDTSFRKGLFFFLSLAGTGLSVLSKENGITTLLLIFFIEIALFHRNRNDHKKKMRIWGGIVLFTILAVTVCYALGFNPMSMLKYNDRPFSLYERVLTQPRVLIFYLSQIFYPLPQRLSLEHDIIISTGLFSPFSTFLCITAVSTLFFTGLFCSRLNPLTRISILFYFGGHAIESTILPLEMIFEHRNYMPSMLLFAPFSDILYDNLRMHKKTRLVNASLLFFIPSILFLFTFATYTRNQTWASTESMIADTLKKAPQGARPKQMAGYLYDIAGNKEKALNMYQNALSGFTHKISYKSAAYLNIGIIFGEKKEFAKAIESINKAIDINPNLNTAYYAKAQIYANQSEWDEAIKTLKYATEKWSNDPDLLEMSGVCHMRKKKYQAALDQFRKALMIDKESASISLNIGECLSVMGYSDRAAFFFRRVVDKNPSAPEPYFWAAKNRFLNGENAKATILINHFFMSVGAESIKSKLLELKNNNRAPLIDFEKMEDFINESFTIYKQKL